MSDKAPSTANYTVDPGQSNFTLQAFATGLLAGFGHNPTIRVRDFSGEAQFVPDTLADASVRLVIRTDSLSVIDAGKEKDRLEIEHTMLTEVLETASYPEIIFESGNITATKIAEGKYKAKVVGDLTLHGVTRKGLWITGQLTASGEDFRTQGEATIKQTDYKIKIVSIAVGALKLKDEVKLTFDLLWHRASG